MTVLQPKGAVTGKHIAFLERISCARVYPFIKPQEGHFKIFTLKKFGRVLFGCGAAGHADSGAIKLKNTGRPKQSWNKKALSIKIANPREFDPELQVA